jgi:DNA-binding CsgD family transcriptional regulator
VETHVYRLLEQLGVNNRTEAANIAMRCMVAETSGSWAPSKP